MSGESQHFSSQIPEKASILSSLAAYRGRPITGCWEVAQLCAWRTSVTGILAHGHCLPCRHCRCWRRGIEGQDNTRRPASQIQGWVSILFIIPGKQRQREPIGHEREGNSVLDSSPGLLSESLSSLSLTHTQVLAPVAEKLTVVCVWWHHPLVEAMGLITEGAWTSPRAGLLWRIHHTDLSKSVFF